MSDVDEVKSRVNIVDIVGKSVKLKKAGRNFKGLCPFHNEKTPSFIVSPDRQTFHCFGCGKGGDAIAFFMEYHHVDFPEALADLGDVVGVKLTRRAPGGESEIREKLYAVNHLASEFYHYMLTKHALGENARVYLKGRGISDKSIVTFGLGYSPNSWDALMKFLRKKGYDEEVMEKAGLIIKSQNSMTRTQKYYDRFRGRVMFTLKDHRGNVVGFAGRVLDPPSHKASDGQAQAKYINTSETPVYVKSNLLYGLDVTKAAIQKANEAVVMEGELDVISSFQAGIGNVVAIKGSALTEGHVRLLKRFTERVAFALDSDLAGDAAARRGIEIADAAGLDMRVVTLPSGKDPDEAARTSPGLLKKAIADAVPVYDYFLSSASSRFDRSTAYGKKKISEELLPILAKIENPIVQNHYTKKVAETIGVSEESIAAAMRRTDRDRVRPAVVVAASTQPILTRPEKLEVYILALLLQGKTTELLEDLQEEGLLPEFTQPVVHRILDALVGHVSTTQVFLIKDFADTLEPELIPTFDEAFLWDLTDTLISEELFAREWLGAIREFRKIILRRSMHTLTQEAAGESVSALDAQKIRQKLQELSVSLKRLEKSS